MSQKVPFYIAFDTAHKPRGRISSNYKTLKKKLEDNEYQCVEFAEFPINRQKLGSFDILVECCPDFAKFSSQEIEAIKQWVVEDGGGLLLLSHAGGDKGRRSNLSELAEQFGMMFENDQVLDKHNNLGVENLPRVTIFPTPHPITEGMNELCFRAGCSLTNITTTNISVMVSSFEAEPPSTPLLLAGESGEGRVVCLGSYEMFRDKITGGIEYENHSQFLLNIFNWLKTTKREKIKVENGGTKPKQIQKKKSQPIDESISEETNEEPISSIPVPLSPLSFTSEIKITTKDEIYKILMDFQDKFNAFRDYVIKGCDLFRENFSTLIGAITAHENDFKSIDLINQSPPPGTYIQEIPMQSPSTPTAPDSSPNYNQYPGPKKQLPPLTPLPIKPYDPNLSTQTPVNTWQQPVDQSTYSQEYNTNVQNENPPIVEENKSLIGKSKEELQAELQSLENKLGSIKDLRTFVQKKYESKKFTESEYDKQVKKLDSDISKTKFQIEEIKSQLSKI